MFLGVGYDIPEGTAVTIFPGVYRILKSGKRKLKYSVSVNAFPSLNNEWILDASRWRNKQNHGVGHFINSSHPMLPAPYTSPNCELREELPHLFDTATRPPLVFVVTKDYLTGPVELLLDYHWLLKGMKSKLVDQVLNCGCEKCNDVNVTM